MTIPATARPVPRRPVRRIRTRALRPSTTAEGIRRSPGHIETELARRRAPARPSRRQARPSPAGWLLAFHRAAGRPVTARAQDGRRPGLAARCQHWAANGFGHGSTTPFWAGWSASMRGLALDADGDDEEYRPQQRHGASEDHPVTARPFPRCPVRRIWARATMPSTIAAGHRADPTSCINTVTASSGRMAPKGPSSAPRYTADRTSAPVPRANEAIATRLVPCDSPGGQPPGDSAGRGWSAVCRGAVRFPLPAGRVSPDRGGARRRPG